ncbi:MAG: hypothetical protein Q8J92_04630 [Parvibaculum sp.]|uniref:hypothetical protein n=1 Tax=Parvibaculum sp. TaxID=2024848 RepID=UPI0027286FB2|nr:hypothetical protein [Parvibaculum sp.]MDO8838587.1 hypothetical protein [Parvibaculum sp.]MDP2123648.1 hypothetical protein [Parvibaculum sp.]
MAAPKFNPRPAQRPKGGLALARAREETARRQKEALLVETGIVIPLSEWLGHNNGPDLLVSTAWQAYAWRKAHEKAWKLPPIEVVNLRCKRAEALGLSYREYTLALLDRGRYL